MRFFRSFLALSFVIAFNAVTFAESAPEAPLMLVTWYKNSGIALPSLSAWNIEHIAVYDKGTRPAIQLFNQKDGIAVSYLLYENYSGKPSSEGCREDGINPIIESLGTKISDRKDSVLDGTSGRHVAVTEYRMSLVDGQPLQRNLFGFVGIEKMCAEIHLSTVESKKKTSAVMDEMVKNFSPDFSYQPKSLDYFLLATLLFKGSPGESAPYYKEALNHLPDGPEMLKTRRIITDQLVMALGISGDLKNSRAVAEMAIKSDSAYPLNYYNLACGYAEEGDVKNARLQLQRAFDNRKNLLESEKMPDPRTDDSFLKLKSNKEFWTFVESLPKN
ncbi:MAG: hypothetical protein JSS87_07440 [Acidobacteria bacterium]|nr:hypothetical protein [Acidobacteriota bacterium]